MMTRMALPLKTFEKSRLSLRVMRKSEQLSDVVLLRLWRRLPRRRAKWAHMAVVLAVAIVAALAPVLVMEADLAFR